MLLMPYFYHSNTLTKQIMKSLLIKSLRKQTPTIKKCDSIFDH